MKMYAVSFVADGFKTLIITAPSETTAKRAVADAFHNAVFLRIQEVAV